MEPLIFQELELSMNEITEFIVSKDLRGPSNLSTLYLDSMRETYYGISTLNLQSLVKLPFIKSLSLTDNHFQVQIFREALCQLDHLQELNVRYNDLTGNLPWCLANFTSLRKLDLSRNQFSGEISLSPLESLTSLQYLDLSNNQFSGDMSLSPLQSLTSLQYLDLSNNLFQIPISLTPLFNLSLLTFLHIDNNTIYAETEDHNLSPKFQL